LKKLIYNTSLVIGILISLTTSLQAQQRRVPGYQGKRFLVKVDPLSPIYQKGIIAGLDYVVGRQLAFSVIYNDADRQYLQRLSSYKQNFGRFPKEKGNIKDKQAGIEIQFFPNQSVPAPKGYFIFANYFQGFATGSGHTYDTRNGGQLIPYELDNLRTSSISLGIGNKSIFKNRIVFEFDLALTAGNIKIPVSTSSEQSFSFQSFTDQYGPNLYSFGEFLDNGGIGISFHLKAGALLF
jgi:hypothetical protein